MWWPSGWPLIPSRLFSHLHLLVAAQAGLKFVCVFGHDGLLHHLPALLRRKTGGEKVLELSCAFYLFIRAHRTC